MYGHQYTLEEHAFLRDYIQGHTYKEIQAEFSKCFAWEISVGQVKCYMANHKINNGLTGQFEKGHQPHNKGVKMSKEVYRKVAGTMFKKGNIPRNHRPVGSERIAKDGYVEIKVAEPNRWYLKHRVVWESAHGLVPEGKCIIFLNGDKTDVQIENLMMIDRRVNARMNQNSLRYDNPDSTKSAVAVAELMSAIGAAKKRKR